MRTMPDQQFDTRKTVPRDLLIAASLLAALALVYWMDINRVSWFVQGSSRRTAFDTSGGTPLLALDQPHAAGPPANAATTQPPQAQAPPAPVASAAAAAQPAGQPSSVQQPAAKPPADIPMQRTEPPAPKSTPPPPSFVGTQPAVPVFRTERPPAVPEQKVEFFEVKSDAQTIAFVVDCSSSMDGGRFDRTRMELAWSIARLRPDQGVFVIFFNHGPVALPGERPDNPALVLATPGVKYEIAKRLSGVVAFGGTSPEESLKIAASVNPDVIFLLSDGGFAPLSPVTEADLATRKIKVNTIAFEDEGGSTLLEQIAGQTGGVYRFVPASDTTVSPQTVAAELALLLIEDLRTASPADRDLARRRLVELSGGKDFGPVKKGDADLEQALARWETWALDLVAQGYQTLPQAEIVKLMHTGSPRERRAAIMSARMRNLPITLELIAVVGDADAVVSQQARQALILLADHCDFGPAEDATEEERAQSTARWKRWHDCQAIVTQLISAGQPAIVKAMRDVDAARRWSAISAARQKKLSIPTELVQAVHDTDADVRDEAARSLVALLPRGSLGPVMDKVPGRYVPDALIELLSDASPEVRLVADRILTSIAEAADQKWSRSWKPDADDSPKKWTAWWTAVKNKRADSHFILAKQLFDSGRHEPAAVRFRDIIRDFPGTDSAKKSQTLLKRIEDSSK